MKEQAITRYVALETEARGLLIEVKGKWMDAVEMVIWTPGRTSEKAPLRFVLTTAEASALSERLVLAATAKGEPPSAPH